MQKLFSIVLVALLVLAANLTFGQDIKVSQVSFPTTVDVGPQCSGGQIHDDGVAENGYGWNATAGNPSGWCMKFIPTTYPYKFTKFCIGLTRLSTGVANFTFTITMWKSVNGMPTAPFNTVFMDTVTVTAAGLPVWPAVSFFDFPLPSTWANVTGTDSVFIGIKYNPVTMTGVFVASDESTTTPLWPGYCTVAAGPWNTFSFYTTFALCRSLLFRAEGGSAAPSLCNKVGGNWCPANTFPVIPAATYFNCSAWIGDTLYVHAPTSAGAGASTIYRYSWGGSWTTGVPMPVTKVGGSMTACNGKLYYVGGGSTSILTPETSVYEYNPGTGAWTAKASIPLAVSAHGAVNWGDSVIVVVGGPYTGAGTNLNVYYYRPALDSWGTIVNSLPSGQGRRTFGMGLCGNKIVISCGYNTAYLKSTYVGTIGSDASSITWVAGPDNAVALSRPAGTGYSNFFFLSGGDTNGTAVKNPKAFIFDVNTNNWTAHNPILNNPHPVSNMMNALTAKCINDTVRLFQPGGYDVSALGINSFDVTGCGGLITGGNIITTVTPLSYVLNQNYPNPFNPETRINYALPKSGLVTLKVYDVLGREVMTLVNEMKSAGNYSIDFNGANLSSGIYFYSLKSGDFTSVKKMTLIK